MKLSSYSDDTTALQLIEGISRRMGLRISRTKEQGDKSREELQKKIRKLQEQLKGSPENKKEYLLPDNDRALMALEELAEYGSYRDIEDAVEWLREITKD